MTTASLAVAQEAIDAGVWAFGAGLNHQKASIASTEREAIGMSTP